MLLGNVPMRTLVILAAAISMTTSATAQTRKQSDPVVQSVTPKHVPNASDLEAAKFRAAAELRQKTWDAKMKAAVSGVCQGC
jgi:hypothetical protein